MLTCVLCKKRKPKANFRIKFRKGKCGFSKRCGACHKLKASYNRDRHIKSKRLVMQAYGKSICKCCGEAHLEFLSIDHKYGKKSRLALGHDGTIKLYRALTRDGFPHKDKLRVLCFNCNWSTRNGRICPHQL